MRHVVVQNKKTGRKAYVLEFAQQNGVDHQICVTGTNGKIRWVSGTDYEIIEIDGQPLVDFLNQLGKSGPEIDGF